MLVRRDRTHLAWRWLVRRDRIIRATGFAPSIFDALANAIGIAYAPILGVSIAIAALVMTLITDIED